MLLARAGARATFFVIGEQVERRPALLAEIAAAGHAVALHGYRHRLQLRLRAREVEDDLARGIAVIEDAIGRRPTLHRPPYGIYSPAGLAAARGGWFAAAAVVTLGEGLAEVHDPGAHRGAVHAGSRSGRRDSPARCRLLQRPQLSSPHRSGT